MFFEKVNPAHPDKIADRIAGAIVDLAYKKQRRPKVAAEVLIGHGECNIIIETSVEDFTFNEINDIVCRITNRSDIKLNLKICEQDKHLADNQKDEAKCGDNGIFKGVIITTEQQKLSNLTKKIYDKYRSDGKYIYDEVQNKYIICQSKADDADIHNLISKDTNNSVVVINPLGYWEGGIDVDSGATNRKLGSDMGDAITGGGLHGKDLSKADVSINIVCHVIAQKWADINPEVYASCAIGDNYVTYIVKNSKTGKTEYTESVTYEKMINIASIYIEKIGGFEKLAEYGLIRPV